MALTYNECIIDTFFRILYAFHVKFQMLYGVCIDAHSHYKTGGRNLPALDFEKKNSYIVYELICYFALRHIGIYI